MTEDNGLQNRRIKVVAAHHRRWPGHLLGVGFLKDVDRLFDDILRLIQSNILSLLFCRLMHFSSWPPPGESPTPCGKLKSMVSLAREQLRQMESQLSASRYDPNLLQPNFYHLSFMPPPYLSSWRIVIKVFRVFFLFVQQITHCFLST